MENEQNSNQGAPVIAGARPELKEQEKIPEPEEVKEEPKEEPGISTHIFALRTTANREDQAMDFPERLNRHETWIFTLMCLFCGISSGTLVGVIVAVLYFK